MAKCVAAILEEHGVLVERLEHALLCSTGGNLATAKGCPRTEVTRPKVAAVLTDA